MHDLKHKFSGLCGVCKLIAKLFVCSFIYDSNSSSYSNSWSSSRLRFVPLESLLYSSSISILISVFTFTGKFDEKFIDEEDGPGPPLNFPLTFELTLNVGFGIETICFFAAFGIDWRLRFVDTLALPLPPASADLVIRLGWISAARSL